MTSTPEEKVGAAIISLGETQEEVYAAIRAYRGTAGLVTVAQQRTQNECLVAQYLRWHSGCSVLVGYLHYYISDQSEGSRLLPEHISRFIGAALDGRYPDLVEAV